MLKSLEKIFETNRIETGNGDETIELHSHTSKAQGLFLQKIFDKVKPVRSLEIGFAYGISAMFILEKHRENNSADGAHIVVEPDSYWGNTAAHNIEKEVLTKYLQIKRDYSDRVLTALYRDGYSIQYAYVDTTKRFDIVFQDFYFIDKILDTGGVIILDDCGGAWPGVQRVARFINTLSNYRVIGKHNRTFVSSKRKAAAALVTFLVKMIPFKKKIYATSDFTTDRELGLDYSCIAFQKISKDEREWNYDRSF